MVRSFTICPNIIWLFFLQNQHESESNFRKFPSNPNVNTNHKMTFIGILNHICQAFEMNLRSHNFWTKIDNSDHSGVYTAI